MLIDKKENTLGENLPVDPVNLISIGKRGLHATSTAEGNANPRAPARDKPLAKYIGLSLRGSLIKIRDERRTLDFIKNLLKRDIIEIYQELLLTTDMNRVCQRSAGISKFGNILLIIFLKDISEDKIEIYDEMKILNR